MKTYAYNLITFGSGQIRIGRQGENLATRIDVDVTPWKTEYPSGNVSLFVVPPAGNGYLAALEENGNTIRWTIRDTDTAYDGHGKAELILKDASGAVMKSVTAYTICAKSPSAAEPADPPEAIRPWVEQILEAIQVEETDPTVPDWAKQPQKPTYTASEVGALPSSYTPPVTSVNGMTGAVALSAQDVGARPDTWTPSASEVGADAAGTASGAVAAHNVSGAAHADLRAMIDGLTSRMNALADSDDTTLDQLSEIVAYIKNNKTLIDAVTTGKVSVSDIVDNLTTNASGKVLSAAQGVALKAMIDGIVIPTALPNPQPITINGQRYDGSDAVTVTTAEIDDTLTQSGKAADAKAVGDQLSALNEANADLNHDLSDVDTRLSESITEISDVAKRLELSYLKTTWEYGDLISNGVEADSTYLKRTGYLDEKIITFEAKGTKVYVYYFDKNKVFKMYKSYAEDHIISVAEYDDVKYIRLVIREEYLNTAVFKTSYPMNDGTLGYITPEIFGAIGDGLTDDTEAVQKCFEFARVTSQLGDFPKRIKLAQSYNITNTILISGLRYCDVSVDGKILYRGVESAFLISGCRFTDFSFGIISAASGDCIRFESNSNTDDYVAYCKLKFKRLYAKNACIRMSIGATGGYINENTIVGGNLSNGEYGIYVDAKGRSEVQFKSYNLGFEGVNVGACLDGASYCSFINPRYGEMKDKILIQTLSETKHIQFVGIDLLLPSMLELSANTSMSIYAPIIHAHNEPVLSYNGKVEGGVLKYAVQTFENA